MSIKSADNINYNLEKTEAITLAKTHTETHTANLWETVLYSNLINFIVVVAFIFWIMKKTKLADIITKKQSETAQSIKTAEAEQKDKQNLLEETKNKVRNIHHEVEKIISENKQISNKLYDNILNDAQKQAEDLVRKAKVSVENQKKVVSGEIASQITGAAFYIAEEHIKKAVDERLHRKYIDNFIDNLDRINS